MTHDSLINVLDFIAVNQQHDDSDLVENAVDKRELRTQIKQLENSLNDIIVYKDNAPKGSAKRTDFARVIHRLRDQIKRLSLRVTRMSESKEGLMKKQNVDDIGSAIIEGFGIHLDEKKASSPASTAISPKTLQTGVWIPWPKTIKHVKYDGGTGVGPGEHKLASLFGGTVQGGSVSYDVIAADGSTWEVKEPDNSTEIRPGTHGLAAISSIMQDFMTIANQIEHAFADVNAEVINTLFTNDEKSIVDNIKTFIANDIPLIRKGEISRGRIFGSSSQKAYAFVDVLREINRLMLPKPGKRADDTKRIVYSDKEYNVDMSTFVHVGNVLHVPEDEMHVDMPDVFKAKFMHPAFRQPVEFIERYMTSITPSTVFSKTDGVILVRQNAFMIVPKANLDDYLKFSRITQGKPKFKYVQ